MRFWPTFRLGGGIGHCARLCLLGVLDACQSSFAGLWVAGSKSSSWPANDCRAHRSLPATFFRTVDNLLNRLLSANNQSFCDCCKLQCCVSQPGWLEQSEDSINSSAEVASMAGTALSGLQSGSKSLRELADELDDYIERGPHRLNVLCFVGGAAIVLNGIFSVLDVFNVFGSPVYYVVNLYMVFFGAVTCVTEARPTFAAQLHDTVQGVQRWMHEWAKGLTLIWGRGLFYIFQGTFCVLSSSLLSLGILIGAYMLVIGLVCLKVGYKRHMASASPDYIRITE